MHNNCYCYYRDNKPVIEKFEYPAATTVTAHLAACEIIFVLRGRLHIGVRYNEELDCDIEANQFVLIPIGSSIECSVVDDTATLVFRQTEDVPMPACHNEMFKADSNSVTGGGGDESVYALRANERIEHFIAGVILAMRDGLTCNLYMQYEVQKLLFLIHSYYTKEECARFFAPLVNPDAKFSEFVRLNYDKYNTVAQMAEAMRMSPTQFAKRFKNVFQLTPKEWIQRSKARRIHWELCQGTKEIKEIADEYGLLPENLIRFCKQRLGATPATIRRNTALQNEK